MVYPAETRQLWDWFQSQKPCMEAGEMSDVCEDHLGLLDGRIGIVREVQDLGGRAAKCRTKPLSPPLADLTAQRGRIAALLERLNAPPPPWTGPTMTRAEVRAAFERGEYEDIGTILQRLRNGGSLSKD